MDPADISVIYQDHHLLIINKPAGVVIHPTYKHTDDTLWNALLVYLEQQGGDDWRPPVLPDEPDWLLAPPHIREMLRQRREERLWREEGLLPRPCLLHRLDKDTSGVVALARTARACNHLARQFNQHTIVKHYLAVVRKGAPDWTRPRTTFTIAQIQPDGSSTPLDLVYFDELPTLLPASELLLDGPLWRDPLDRRRCVVLPGGQPATTRVSVLAAEKDVALLEILPITGRTHQIRAHLAALGFAIVGDPVYAPPAPPGTPASALARQFLHAYRLDLRDYPADQPTSFVAPLANDLITWQATCCPSFTQILSTLL
ncbi:MAG: RluA family pseudouridine synthase [Ktedonobacteraceae bacterium]|nr:RluA family pseudouridine synthase [Ktedonobacteraceae bacterium]